MSYRPIVVLAGVLMTAASLGTPADAHVSDNASSSSLNASIREWMSHYQVPAASVAVMQGDRLVATFGFGGMSAGTPARIASLSKAITGVCIAQLIDAGRLSFTAPLGTVLARAFARFGRPADARFNTITIEQLLMHRAGLARESSRGSPARDLTGSFTNLLATPLNDDPGTTMTYSNIGYLALGMVVETVTGRDYERYCRDVALTPMNAAGTIDPQLRPRASSGGWRISAVDYARFIRVFEPGSAGLGPLARQWQDSLNGPLAYGLGIAIRRSAQGILLTHTGRVALRERGGAYVIRFPSGDTAVVTFAGAPHTGATADLRRRLETAVAGL